MVPYRYSFALLVSTACLAAALPAAAQDAGNGTNPREEDNVIVVTATRGAAAADNVAARTDVITREDIELYGYVTAVDALKAVPGLSVVQSGGAGGLTSVFSRGTNSKHTLALYDGIRLNDASTPNGQFNFGADLLGDLDRVEVLRGPLAAIYGSDAIGGVINFIPRVGGDTPFQSYGEIAAGNLDTYRGMLGARGTTGALSYAVTSEYFETGGFNTVSDRMADNLGERDGTQFFTLSGNATLNVTDGLSVRALARYRKAKTDFDDAALDRTGRGGRDRYFIWRLAPRYVALDGNYQGDLEFGQVDNKRDEWNNPDANNSYGGANTNAAGLRTFAAWRNRLTLTPAQGVTANLSAGIEWQREKIFSDNGYNTPLHRAESLTSFYGLAQVGIADRLDFNGSVRQDDPQYFDAVTTWNAGAVLHLPEIGGRVYVAYGTSFKAPSLSERYSSGAYAVPNPSLRPEHGKSFEAGLDIGTDIGSVGHVGATATYFDTRIRDLIEYDYATLQNLNVGRAKIDGYELSLHARAGTLLNFNIAYTRTNAFDESTGERLLRRPKHGWSANVTVTPVPAFSVSADYIRRGTREDVLYAPTSAWGPGGGYLGNGTADAYDLVNLSAQYKLIDDVELFATLNNAFDTKYEEPDSYAGAPRTWMIGARARF